MKKQSIIAGITALCLIFGVAVTPENITPAKSITAYSAENTYENLTYKISEDGTIEITGCDKSAVNVIIPENIDGIKITKIGFNAFSGCKNLTAITLPENIEIIHSSAFYGCKNLKEITIPDGVTDIEGSVFANCTNLENISIPDSVKNIKENAFNNCTSLKSIDVSANNENYGSINGILFSKDKSAIIKYPPALSAKSYEIPDGVQIICNYAFSGCINLNEIKLPKSLTDIGKGAFENCKQITEIKLPYKIKSIGNSAFKNCTGLLNIDIPYSLRQIGSEVFSGTAWIKARQEENPLVIVNNILIDGTACKKDVRIPDGVEIINDCAFYGCKEIWGVRFPDSLTRIGDYAFKGCTSLGEPYFPQSLTTIGISAFEGCKNFRILNITESITFIDYNAFRNCTNLSTLAIFNTECIINDEYGSTFSNKYDSETGEYTFRGMIYGYDKSTVQAYAKEYNKTFEAIEEVDKMPSGDVNGDYEFNQDDVVSFQQYLSCTDNAKIFYWQNADLNDDGILDIFDLCLMKKKIAEK